MSSNIADYYQGKDSDRLDPEKGGLRRSLRPTGKGD